MTYLDERTATCAPTRRSGYGRDRTVVAIAVLAAVATWAFASASGDGEVAVRAGSGSREVGVAAVAVAAAVAAAAGAVLLQVMIARLRRGRFWWTVVACAALLVSLLGPLGATELSDGMTLVSLHTVVGAVVIIGLRRAHRSC